MRYLNGQLYLVWPLLFPGEWGEALRLLKTAIDMAEKNEHHLRASTLRLTRAWLHLHAMDFAGALDICEEVLPLFDRQSKLAGPRMYRILAGTAEASLGHPDRALAHLL